MGASKKTIQSGLDLTKKHRQNFVNVKSSLCRYQDQQFEGLEKVCKNSTSNFPLEETRHAVVTDQISTENDLQNNRHSSNMAEHDSSHISSLTILWPSSKCQIPTLKPSLFSKQFLISIFFQI
jgi:hypothetical protein